jgi:uracil-DNA glycosylase
MRADLAIHNFVERLIAARPTSLVNPYAIEDPDLDRPGGADRRARNLEAYLAARIGRSDLLLLVGEAPGYQGCRFSGLAFTSERSLPTEERSSLRPDAWQEPSATIVHRSLAALGLEERTVLWNAVPFHPAGATLLSNRTPTKAELNIGAPYLAALIELLRPAAMAAIGRSAAVLLPEGSPMLRHPAHGGATLFRDGLTALAAGLAMGQDR